MGAFSPMLPRHRRRAINAELEQLLDRVSVLIERLDAADDADRDMEEDDHPGDMLDLLGEAPSDDGRGILAVRPLYALDQTGDPINYAAESRAHRMREMGLVRSDTGR